MMKRIHAFVSGRVQGIFFRAFARDEAALLGLKGYARNLDDGRVEIVAEGGEDALKEFIDILKTRHPVASVDGIEVEWMNSKTEFTGFDIRH